MLYVPPWKDVALIVPPEAAYGLVVAGALAGLALALLSPFAVGTVLFFEPILVSLHGRDPCGGAKGVRQPDTACVLAHPEYYQYDPVAGSLSTGRGRFRSLWTRLPGPLLSRSRWLRPSSAGWLWR